MNLLAQKVCVWVDGHGRTRKDTDGHGLTRTDTNGHGLTRTDTDGHDDVVYLKNNTSVTVDVYDLQVLRLWLSRTEVHIYEPKMHICQLLILICLLINKQYHFVNSFYINCLNVINNVTL